MSRYLRIINSYLKRVGEFPDAINPEYLKRLRDEKLKQEFVPSYREFKERVKVEKGLYESLDPRMLVNKNRDVSLTTDIYVDQVRDLIRETLAGYKSSNGWGMLPIVMAFDDHLKQFFKVHLRTYKNLGTRPQTDEYIIEIYETSDSMDKYILDYYLSIIDQARKNLVNKEFISKVIDELKRRGTI